MACEFDGKKLVLSKVTKMIILLEFLKNKGVINQETYEATKEEILGQK